MYKQCVKYSYRKKPSRIHNWMRDGFFPFIVIVWFCMDYREAIINVWYLDKDSFFQQPVYRVDHMDSLIVPC